VNEIAENGDMTKITTRKPTELDVALYNIRAMMTGMCGGIHPPAAPYYIRRCLPKFTVASPDKSGTDDPIESSEAFQAIVSHAGKFLGSKP
jgi:hypothetical protein